MSKAVTVEVDSAEFENAIKSLLEKASTKDLLEIVRDSAESELVPEMVRLAPHDKGDLRDSIKAKIDGGSVLVGSFGLVYAAIQEFGGIIPITERMRRYLIAVVFRDLPPPTKEPENPGHVTIPPHPYIRPAWRAKNVLMLSDIKRRLRRHLRRARKR